MNGFNFNNSTGKVSFNDKEIIDATSPVVASVNGHTGSAITLVAADVSAYTTDEVTGLLAEKADVTSFAKVAATGSYDDLINAPLTANTVFVAASGDDDTGTGALVRPYRTIQKAHDHVVQFGPADTHVAIFVFPGTYSGAQITRPRLTITGLSGQMFNTNIGELKFQADTSYGVDTTSFGIERVSVNNTTTANPAVELSGTIPATLMMNDVRVYTQQAGAKGVVVNVPGATKSKVRFNLVDINTKEANATSIDMTNANGFANTVYIDSAAGLNLDITDGQLTMAACSLECNGDRLALVDTGGHMFFLNGILRNNKTDADVITLSAAGLVTITDTVVLTDGTNGLVIDGEIGATVRYNNVTFGSPSDGTFTTKASAGMNMQQFANAFTQA